VVTFSFSVPLTMVAVRRVRPVPDPAGCAVIAGVLAAPLLAVRRAPLPRRATWCRSR